MTLEKIAKVNCPGKILDMCLIKNTKDLSIFSSHGLYRINKVIESDFDVIKIPEKITCADLCFLGDGETYFVASGKTLIRRTLKDA